MTQGGRSRGGAGLHQSDRPAVAGQREAHGEGPLPHGPVPVVAGGGQVHLAEHQVDHTVEQVVLVGDVVVQGHRLDPEGLAEPAHAERLQAAGVGEFDGGPQHALTGERPALGLWRLWWLRGSAGGHCRRSLSVMRLGADGVDELTP